MAWINSNDFSLFVTVRFMYEDRTSLLRMLNRFGSNFPEVVTIIARNKVGLLDLMSSAVVDGGNTTNGECGANSSTNVSNSLVACCSESMPRSMTSLPSGIRTVSLGCEATARCEENKNPLTFRPEN
jgi:hypothetical protein